MRSLARSRSCNVNKAKRFCASGRQTSAEAASAAPVALEIKQGKLWKQRQSALATVAASAAYGRAELVPGDFESGLCCTPEFRYFFRDRIIFYPHSSPDSCALYSLWPILLDSFPLDRARLSPSLTLYARTRVHIPVHLFVTSLILSFAPRLSLLLLASHSPAPSSLKFAHIRAALHMHAHIYVYARAQSRR